MNNRFFLPLFTVLILLIACNSKLTQPENKPLTYNGIVVSESTPAFLSSDGITRSTNSSGQIENDPPYGTVLGHENDPDNVYLAQGGEILPSGSWADQMFQAIYSTTLYGNTIAEFANTTTVTILNPIDCYYLNSIGNWVQVSSSQTVQTTVVKTGLNGSCTIQSNTLASIGNGGID